MQTQTINRPGFVPPPIFSLEDRGRALGRFHLDLYEARRLRSGRDLLSAKPFDTRDFHNLITNTGVQLMEDLLIGAGGTTLATANCYVGVGDDNTAVSASHTNLQAVTNKLRNAVSSSSRSSQTLSFVATFATGDANWSWQEMAAFNASSSGVMFARALVTSPFTKTSSLSIVATYTWTVS